MQETMNRLKENLGKLQRNEAQMSEAQKKQFAKPLAKLRKGICADASEVVNSFIRGGIRISTEDNGWKDVIRGIEKIMKEEKENGSFRAISAVLFRSFDIDQMLTAALPIWNRVWYEAYGPYWLSHCMENPLFPDFPYHNDLIGMDWFDGHNIWASTKIEDGEMVADYEKGFSIMLPPTKELLERKYVREMKEAKEAAKNVQQV